MFDHYFDVFLADTPESKKINYQIRYQVYCLETGYEDPETCPEKMENDSFDDRSVHFIVRAKQTGIWIAALRLVVGPMDELPINHAAVIDTNRLLTIMSADSVKDFDRSAEISRLSIVSDFRRRKQERDVPFQLPWTQDECISDVAGDTFQERRKAPWLMLSLLYAARDYSEQHGINYWFFLTPKALARIFKGLGMQLEVTGPACEHRGTRFPHVIKIPSGFDNFEIKYPGLGKTIPRSNRYRLFSEVDNEIAKLRAAV